MRIEANWWLFIGCVLIDRVNSGKKRQANDDDKMPFFENSGGHHEIDLGSRVALSCRVKNLGAYSIVWTKGGNDTHKLIVVERQAMVEDGHITTSESDDDDDMENWDIFINDAEASDSGEYFCEISTVPETMKLKHTLLVKVPAAVKIIPEQLTLKINAGNPLRLTCQTSGNPVPNVTWIIPDAFPSDNKIISGPELSIESTSREHDGIYKCRGSNNVGDISESAIQVHIIYPPSVTQHDQINFASVGDAVNLTCSYKANPNPSIFWYHNGNLIKSIPDNFVGNHESSSQLSFNDVKTENYGIYACKLANELGEAECIINLAGPPDEPEIQIDFSKDMFSWRLKSWAPILEIRLEYRRTGLHVQTFKKVEATYFAQLPSGEYVYNGDVDLGFLQSAQEYQLTLRSRNQYGWSGDSKHPFAYRYEVPAKDATQAPAPLKTTSGTSGHKNE